MTSFCSVKIVDLIHTLRAINSILNGIDAAALIDSVKTLLDPPDISNASEVKKYLLACIVIAKPIVKVTATDIDDKALTKFELVIKSEEFEKRYADLANVIDYVYHVFVKDKKDEASNRYEVIAQSFGTFGGLDIATIVLLLRTVIEIAKIIIKVKE